MKFYFISSIFFSIFLTLIVVNDSYFKRMLLIIPTIILFFLTFLLFAFDYDKEQRIAWKKKEEKLKDEIYFKITNSKLNKFFK